MGTISYTIPTAGSTLNQVADPEVSTALQTLLTLVNGNIDGANVAATLTGRRLVASAAAFVPGGQIAGNYFLAADGTLVASGAGSLKALMWTYLDPTNFSVSGKANTQLIIRMSLAINSIAPTISFQAKLASLTFATGTAGTIAPTFGAAPTGTAGIATPSSNPNVAESAGGAFAFPSAGAYAPVINLDGTTAANSATSILWQLFALNS